jgi:hypothetical protein
VTKRLIYGTALDTYGSYDGLLKADGNTSERIDRKGAIGRTVIFLKIPLL